MATTEPRTGAALVSMISGVAIAVGGLLVPWIASAGEHSRLGTGTTGIGDLFRMSYGEPAARLHSVGLILGILGLAMLIGGGIASRLLVALAGLLTLVIGALWVLMAMRSFPDLSLAWNAFWPGAWLAALGGLLGLLSSLFLRRRIKVRESEELVYDDAGLGGIGSYRA